jgi:hypothetical protein
MAANVLNSIQAIKMSVLVVRAFVRMRHILVAYKELTGKLSELERIGTQDEHIQNDFRSNPAAHDAAKAQQAKNWIPGRGESRRLRAPIAPAHFDVSEMPKRRPVHRY